MIVLNNKEIERKPGITDEEVSERTESFQKKVNAMKEMQEKLKNKELGRLTFFAIGELFDIIEGLAKARKKSKHIIILDLVFLGLEVMERERAEAGKESLVDVANRYNEKINKERQDHIRKVYEKELSPLTDILFEVKR